MIDFPWDRRYAENLEIRFVIYLSPSRRLTRRSFYNIPDLLTDLGGFISAIFSFFKLIAFPFTNYLYQLVMIKRLYFADTADEDLFDKETDK